MTTLRRLGFMTMAALLVGGEAVAQAATDEPSATKEPEDKAWSFSASASAYAYLVPHEDDYLQPTVTADWTWLHLEARYNYEDRGA